MNADTRNTTTQTDKDKEQDKKQGKGVLEKIAETIDPPSREISTDELLDPGSNIPPGRPGDKDAAQSNTDSSRAPQTPKP